MPNAATHKCKLSSAPTINALLGLVLIFLVLIPSGMLPLPFQIAYHLDGSLALLYNSAVGTHGSNDVDCVT